MDYLIYLVYGGTDYANEALYSLLSFYRFYNATDIQVVVYTDDVAFFSNRLPDDVQYVPLSSEQLTDWKGPSGFNHRIKIKALQDATVRFQGNILYCDTDTHFTQSIAPLFQCIGNGGIVFHEAEGSLDTRKGNVARKMRDFFSSYNTFAIASQTDPIYIDASLKVWNAGIIGFNTKYKDTLQQVLELTDAFCAKSNIFVLEQVAFNYFFQKLAAPVSSEKEVEHYWYFKEFRGVLRHFFEYHSGKTLLELTGEMDKILPFQLSEEKRAYKVMGFWQKQFTKLTKGAKWRIRVYKL